MSVLQPSVRDVGLVYVVSFDTGVVPLVADPMSLDLHLPTGLHHRVSSKLAHILKEKEKEKEKRSITLREMQARGVKRTCRRKFVDLGGTRVLLQKGFLGEMELNKPSVQRNRSAQPNPGSHESPWREGPNLKRVIRRQRDVHPQSEEIRDP